MNINQSAPLIENDYPAFNLTNQILQKQGLIYISTNITHPYLFKQSISLQPNLIFNIRNSIRIRQIAYVFFDENLRSVAQVGYPSERRDFFLEIQFSQVKVFGQIGSLKQAIFSSNQMGKFLVCSEKELIQKTRIRWNEELLFMNESMKYMKRWFLWDKGCFYKLGIFLSLWALLALAVRV